MVRGVPAFSRSLSQENLGILWSLAAADEPNWFKDALADTEVFFAVRNERVDAYSGGALIYKIEFRGGAAIPQTHVKYLIREPQSGQAYVAMRDGTFDYGPHARMQSDYRVGSTLDEIKKASSYYAPPRSESNGVHRAILGDPLVLDLELSLVQPKARIESAGEPPLLADENGKRSSTRQDRIDIVRLEPNDVGYHLVFWEAKHYRNSDLFNGRVLEQIKRYRGQIESCEDVLIEQYRNVCGFQAEIQRMRLNLDLPVDRISIQTMEALANHEIPLAVDIQPRLFAFGFDGVQKENRWKKRMAELQAALGAKHRVRAIGEPKGGELGR